MRAARTLSLYVTREVIQYTLLGLAAITMILVTHEIAFAKKLSSRVIFLENGRIVADKPKDEFFSASFSGENKRISDFLARSEDM